MFGRAARIVAVMILVIILLPYLVAPLYRFVDPVSTLMLWRSITGQRVERRWVPLAELPAVLPVTVIAAEDGRFCHHWGVDFRELRAAVLEAEDLSELRGGSTITQQVAKNLFLWQSRSVVRKALEFPMALWVDLVLTKPRILEIYLNVAEWGPRGEFGVEAGSRYAFGKSARAVSQQEAGLLAAVLPNPFQRSARRPGPGMRRLAGIYQRRAVALGAAADCARSVSAR
jgi:monofunctional biosynthetic peptidoglycan transglycosylase